MEQTKSAPCRRGFEPLNPEGLPAFQAGALNHSATLLSANVLQISDITKYFGQKSAQNKEKIQFIPHMLAYVGIFL